MVIFTQQLEKLVPLEGLKIKMRRKLELILNMLLQLTKQKLTFQISKHLLMIIIVLTLEVPKLI